MRAFIIIVVSCCLLLTSCHTHRKLASSKHDKGGKNEKHYKQYTVESYIEEFKPIAIEQMHTYGIPASITLAQAINESANGNSYLARHANNHFGIKCTTSWKGEKVYRDGDGKNDCYRSYNSAEESFRDHADFLTRDRYAKLFKYKSTSYKKWAYGLRRTGYATNPKYPHLLIDIIEKYNLHSYDKKVHRKHRG